MQLEPNLGDTQAIRPDPLSAFSGTFPPTKVSFLYQAGLGFVALAMMMLPLIYLGLIALAIWAVKWHLETNWVIFDHVHGRGAIAGIIAYGGPAIIGVIFVLFLIKPLFSRSKSQSTPFLLDPRDEPTLFPFIHKICDLVGAPHPTEVRLDNLVNASAGFRRGWLSLFGKDLVLTIGLPLAAGITMRQMAGILAHEFGHFAQGAGMRFTYIIRSVNMWFARVVYERDHWDETLDEWARDSDWRLQIILKTAQGGVWIGRKVLWLLMQVGHALSCFMSRQMEFDADSYEAKLAGSDEFPKTARRLRYLGTAHAAAMNDAQAHFNQRELPDDLAALTRWRESQIPDDVRSKIDQASSEEKTHWASTHPADGDRNRAALAIQAPGVFHLEESASELFSDFTATCLAVTRHHYDHDLELKLDKVTFKSVEEASADRSQAQEAEKNLELFFGSDFHLARIGPLPVASPAQWQSAKEQMEYASETYAATLEKWVQSRRRLTNQQIGLDLMRAGFNLTSPGEFDLIEGDATAAQESIVRTNQELANLGAALESFETNCATRLAAALSSSGGTPEAGQLDQMIERQRTVAEAARHVWPLIIARQSLEVLCNHLGNSPSQTHVREIETVAERVSALSRQITTALGDLTHPYIASQPTVASLIEQSADNPIATAFSQGSAAIDTVLPLLSRLTGQLAGWALAAEADLSSANPTMSQTSPPAAEPGADALEPSFPA